MEIRKVDYIRMRTKRITKKIQKVLEDQGFIIESTKNGYSDDYELAVYKEK